MTDISPPAHVLTSFSLSEPILYVDLLSQPSRACAIFCKLNSLPVEISPVFIHKGQTKSKEYRLKNPLGKVPFLEDGPLALPESIAILTYLATKFNTPEHWYPRSSPQERAMVDAALHWYHSNVRAGCARIVFNTVIAQRLGLIPNQAYADEGREILHLALIHLQSYWLQGGGRPFMAGDRISLPDLICCCEMEQLIMLKKDRHGTDLEDQLRTYPLIKDWMIRVRAECGSTYDEVHSVLRRSATPLPNSKL